MALSMVSLRACLLSHVTTSNAALSSPARSRARAVFRIRARGGRNHLFFSHIEEPASYKNSTCESSYHYTPESQSR